MPDRRTAAILAITTVLLFPLGAFARTVSVELTEVLLDREQEGADLALLGMLTKLERAFPVLFALCVCH